MPYSLAGYQNPKLDNFISNVYATTKFGVRGFSKTLNYELKKSKIRVSVRIITYF